MKNRSTIKPESSQKSEYLLFAEAAPEQKPPSGAVSVLSGKEPYMAAKKKAETTPVLKTTGRVFGGALNIRKEPSIDSEPLGILKDGEQIEILETVGDWYKIEPGYVMAKWVKLDGTD